MSDIGQRRADTVHTLEGTAPFRGIAPAEISAMLGCLGVREQTFQAGEIVYRMGDTVHALGIVLTGGVRMERTDPWGETSVLGFAGTGDVFAESYACTAGTPLLVNVIAAEKTRVLFLDTVRALRPCSPSSSPTCSRSRRRRTSSSPSASSTRAPRASAARCSPTSPPRRRATAPGASPFRSTASSLPTTSVWTAAPSRASSRACSVKASSGRVGAISNCSRRTDGPIDRPRAPCRESHPRRRWYPRIPHRRR